MSLSKKIIILSIVSLIIIAALIICFMNVKNEDEYVHITTNYFVSKVSKIIDEKENYISKKVSISGYIHYSEEGYAFVTRDYITSNGIVKIGLMIKGNDVSKFKENDWVKIEGVIKYMVSDYEVGEEVPYIAIKKIYKEKEQKDDRNVVN